jgi:hypothetical protein
MVSHVVVHSKYTRPQPSIYVVPSPSILSRVVKLSNRRRSKQTGCANVNKQQCRKAIFRCHGARPVSKTITIHADMNSDISRPDFCPVRRWSLAVQCVRVRRRYAQSGTPAYLVQEAAGV